MSEFTIHQANYVDGRLHEVLILCRDEPEPPLFFYEETVMPVQDVLNHLKDGDRVWAQWEAHCFPIVRMSLPNGEETIEVVQQGQPAAYRTLAGLPCEERIFGA
ncbi:MAG: hypothetical protein Q7K57_59420 [Burkholderiaceae bacterium]|nr:hypothetical protein [Burkholderiaceae bacterium]